MAPRRPAATVDARLSSGVMLIRFAADRGFGLAMAREAFECAELAAALRLARPGTIAIDAGAHIGAYTLPLARRMGVEGHVFAFEPHPASRALLLRAVAANGLEAHVTVSAAALGEPGAATALRSPRAAGGFALARLDTGAEPLRRTEQRLPVDVCRLDDLDVDRPVSLVKLDIEGSEALALRGATRLLRCHRPAVLCELDEILLRRVSEATPEGLMAWMEHEGYGAFAIAPDGAAGARLTTPPTARTSTILFLPT